VARWLEREKRGETLRYVCGHENPTAERRLVARRSASRKQACLHFSLMRVNVKV
jgi:hypothetical protein